MGGANASSVGSELHWVDTVPSGLCVWKTDRVESSLNLEDAQELVEWKGSRVRSGKHEVHLVKVWLLEAVLGSDDKLVGAQLDGVILLVGRVGENDDLGSESLGELDGEVCR